MVYACTQDPDLYPGPETLEHNAKVTGRTMAMLVGVFWGAGIVVLSCRHPSILCNFDCLCSLIASSPVLGQTQMQDCRQLGSRCVETKLHKQRCIEALLKSRSAICVWYILLLLLLRIVSEASVSSADLYYAYPRALIRVEAARLEEEQGRHAAMQRISPDPMEKLRTDSASGKPQSWHPSLHDYD